MTDEKYKKLVNERLGRGIKYLRMVKKMTASRNYEVDQEDVTSILEALSHEIEGIQSAFDSRVGKKEIIEPIL